MKNLENLGVQELSLLETKKTEGGLLLCVTAMLIGAGISAYLIYKNQD